MVLCAAAWGTAGAQVASAPTAAGVPRVHTGAPTQAELEKDRAALERQLRETLERFLQDASSSLESGASVATYSIRPAPRGSPIGAAAAPSTGASAGAAGGEADGRTSLRDMVRLQLLILDRLGQLDLRIRQLEQPTPRR